MSFALTPYSPPDFDHEPLASAPDAALAPVASGPGAPAPAGSASADKAGAR